jgi:hypothetical protein
MELAVGFEYRMSIHTCVVGICKCASACLFVFVGNSITLRPHTPPKNVLQRDVNEWATNTSLHTIDPKKVCPVCHEPKATELLSE